MAPDLENTVVPPVRPPATGFDHFPVPQAPEPPQRVSRLFGFRLGDTDGAGASEPVLLDRVAYVGRRPAAPRVVRGGQARLVRVASPGDEVSATHLEIRQEGSTVVVTDLRSTNGTRVGAPGTPARALHQGESLVVTPGTLIDIGDGNVIQILPAVEVS